MKPMLASDYDEAKLRFPLGAQPKIDGVRGLNMTGTLTGRSLKTHANRYATAFFSKPEYIGFDGELAAQDERHPDLCRITTSALNTIDGSPFLFWHVFDYLADYIVNEPYLERWRAMGEQVSSLQAKGLALHLRVVPLAICMSLEDLLHWDNVWLEQGYEGTIIRDLNGKHKQGRSTVREMGLLRIKRFIDAEAVVVSITEGQINQNEAKINELGNTARSTHAENMVPSGLVGSMECRLLADVIDPTTKKVLVAKNSMVTVSPGRMPHDMRKHYLEHPEGLVGHVVKFQLFPKGMKDKPRFPTYQSHRALTDMS